MHLHGSVAAIYIALCLSVAQSAAIHKNRKNLHETAAATFLVNQKDGSGVEDDKAAQLSDSIQGLFDPSALKAASIPGSSKSMASDASQKKPEKVAKHVEEKVKSKSAAKDTAKHVEQKVTTKSAAKDTAKHVEKKVTPKSVAKDTEHIVTAKAKSVASKGKVSKPAAASKAISKTLQKAVARAQQQQTAQVSKMSKPKAQEDSGVVQKLKAFVAKNVQQSKSKAVSKTLQAKHADAEKKASMIAAQKSQKKIAQPKTMASAQKPPQTLQHALKKVGVQPQHHATAGARVQMMPTTMKAKSEGHIVSAAPMLAPVPMKSVPVNLASAGSNHLQATPTKDAEKHTSVPSAKMPVKSTQLAKIPVAGQPVHPGGPVPVTKLQVAEKAKIGSNIDKNTNFSWFPFSGASNSSASNVSVHSWFTFSSASSNSSSSNSTAHSSFTSNSTVHSWFHFTMSSVSNASKNSSASIHSSNASNATMDNSTKENKTKEIEKEVESLPMASFAMGLADEAPQNKTEVAAHNKTLNATELAAEKAKAAKEAAEKLAAEKAKAEKEAAEKAAWEKREKVLQAEIVALKAKLENDTMEIQRHHAANPTSPPAAGTFNSQTESSKTEAPKNLLEAVFQSPAAVMVKKPEPMEPLIKEHKPKPDWPSMNSVAAPVTVSLHHPDTSEVPPQKEAMEAQAGDSNKLGLNTAFTGTPVKKVQSVIALDTTVQHTNVYTDDGSAPVENATPAPFSLWNSISSFFSHMFWGTPATPVQHVAAPPVQHVAAPRKAVTALLDTSQHPPTQSQDLRKQDYERTAEVVREEANRNLAPTGVWGDLEAEDRKEEDFVRGEDQFERQRMRTPESPHAESKDELHGRHGTDMSSFWSTLESEDNEIEKSVSSENMGTYERLTQEQDGRVDKADAELQESKLHTDRDPPLKHNDNSFLARTIHEPWENLEQKDKVFEQKIHAAPELQMLQLKDDLQEKLHHH